MKDFIGACILALLAAATVIATAAKGWLGLTLKPEIRPLEAIALVVSLLIALFLQRFFTSKINDLRAEKNLLICTVQEILRVLKDLRDRTDSLYQKRALSAEEKSIIIRGFRRVSNTLTELESAVKMSSLRTIEGRVSELRLGYYSLKESATDGSFPSKGYSGAEQGALEREFTSMTSLCHGLIFAINSSKK